MIHSLLRPRPSAVIVSSTVAVLMWFMTDLQGANRVLNALLAFVLAYLVFNASATYFDLDV